MNPHKINKVDISSMTEQEQKAFKLYGKVPAKNALTKMQKDRKYFDSGDYMMNKAGVGNAQPVGTAIPTPEGVPHASPPGPNSPGILATSPSNNIPNPLLGNNSAIADDSAPSAHAHAQPIGVPGQPQPFHLQHRGSVGVGIGPAGDGPDGIDIPHSFNHARRQSESHRISPPGTLRDGSLPSSSFPIQHHGNNYGSSPVKASSLARRLDEEM